MGFEPMTSCLVDRRANHLSYGAALGDGVVEGLIFEMEPAKQLRSFFVRLTKNRDRGSIPRRGDAYRFCA